ncbi:MAG: drug/metabolite transporter (DMT)-like permease [Saprospiraceae bacterium]|jgi:drug/metabolite transporter (DMT)-like permease
MKNLSSLAKAHLAMLTVALIYGANYSIAKVVLDDGYIQPNGFILLRALVASSILFVLHRIFVNEKIEKKDYGRLILCGIFGAGINMMFFFMGLKATTPINASLIMTMTPILVLLTSAFLIKEKITSRKLLGIVLGGIGTVILTIYGKKFAYTTAIGDLYVLINALSYGVYIVLVKKLMAKYHPMTVIMWVMFFGFFIVLPFGGPELLAADFASFPPKVWYAIFYVLIGATVLTYTLNATALRTVNPSVVSIYIYLQPLTAAIISLFWGTEVLTIEKIIAGTLIFIGVFLVSRK